MDLTLVLGDMLFDGLPGLPTHAPVLMVEDFYLCRRIKHHQQKIVLFLSAMRHFADRLTSQEYTVRYFNLEQSVNCDIFERIRKVVRERGVRRIHTYRPHDSYFADSLSQLAVELDIALILQDSPMFLTSPIEWAKYRANHNRLLMGDFYQWQRRRLGILVDDHCQPVGGKWSFDEENRKPLPKGLVPPAIWWSQPDEVVNQVIQLTMEHFSDHPGNAAQFAWPVTHEQAKEWLTTFLEERLDQFGDYEDAISSWEATSFHSLLTPLLNVGLLTPRDVIKATMRRHEKRPVPLNSLEGFIRQVIGWREFVKCVSTEMWDEIPNFFQHHRRLKACWYDGTTGLLPLDTAIKRASDHGWCHHIERLMVLGSVMLMSEVAPEDSYRWFMEMFIDSADWVMGPNVIGMSQFADGGSFATKPYISGSSYIQKMSDYPVGDWCDIWDGLYWRFIERHQTFFASSPRMSVMVGGLQRLEPARKMRIFRAAEEFIERTTIAAPLLDDTRAYSKPLSRRSCDPQSGDR